MVVTNRIRKKIAGLKAQVDAVKKSLEHVQELLKIEEDAYNRVAGQSFRTKSGPKPMVANMKAEFLKKRSRFEGPMLGGF